jgi:hypothetical protein
MDKDLPKDVLSAYETYRILERDATLTAQAARAAKEKSLKAYAVYLKLENTYYEAKGEL